jgi:hypothetical protein
MVAGKNSEASGGPVRLELNWRAFNRC